MITNVFLLSLFASAAFAVPFTRRDTCTTAITGKLAANVNGSLKPFSVAANGSLTWSARGTNPLAIELQECASLVFPGDDQDIPGRIYVPSQDKCLIMTNQEDEEGPYFPALADCDNTSFSIPYEERWVYEKADATLFWAGETDEEGTILQGGCGLLDYAADSHGRPTTPVTVVCNGSPFKILQ